MVEPVRIFLFSVVSAVETLKEYTVDLNDFLAPSCNNERDEAYPAVWCVHQRTTILYRHQAGYITWIMSNVP